MDITMPQLGETVTEGTITRWIKQVGDAVSADEPLFEVSTDKVDSEVPAPASGTLVEILVPEGETVGVGAKLAVIGDAGAAPAQPPAAEVAPAPEVAAAPAAAPAPAVAPVAAAPSNGASKLASPIVRRLAAEQGVDVATLQGSGDGGRITRNDVLTATPSVAPIVPSAPAPAPTPAAPPAPAPAPAVVPTPAPVARHGDTVIPFDNIRRRTAEHVVRSKATSAHVYTSVEVDFENIERVRAANKKSWKEREGFSLTYLPFIARAFCDAVRDFPNVNASVQGESLVVHGDVNLAIAVDMDFEGLIAPVIHNADGKRLRLIAQQVRDMATRARSRALGPDEVSGGTFTITNPGPYGTFMTLPIINQPQVAIMATDGVRKRPVVVTGPDGTDAIAIHHVANLAIAWDHRAFDGAYAAAFLSTVKDILETRDWEAELA